MRDNTMLGRRTFLGGAAAAAAVAATSACNLAGGGGNGGGGGATLNVWGGVPNETGPDDLCAAFMAEHPDVKVTYTRFVNDDEGNLKLDTSLTGGAGIDMYFSYSPARLFQRADAGLAIDLTDKIAAEDDFAEFRADADPAANYVRDGQVFAIPAARAPVHVYINQSMLDAAGITLGTSWTIDEFVEVARALTSDSVFGTLDYPPQARVMLGPDYRYLDGGTSSNFADPWFSKELELAMTLQDEGVRMDQETIIAEQLQTFSQNPYIAGRVAMLINSGQIIRSINDTTEYPHDFKTYCMPLPTPDTSIPAWNTGQRGDLISISPESAYQDEAWELAKFWMRNAAQFMTKGGRLPALMGDTSEDDILADLLSENADELYDVESWRSMLFSPDLVLPVDSIFTAGTQIDTITRTLTDEYLLGDRDLDSWVTEAVAQSDEAIVNGGA